MFKTIDQIMSVGLCSDYSRDEVEALVGSGIDEDQLNALSIHRLDILWALVYIWFTPIQTAFWVRDCIGMELKNKSKQEFDPGIIKAVDVAWRYINGDVTLEALEDAKVRVWGVCFDIRNKALWGAGSHVARIEAWEDELERQISWAMWYIKEVDDENTRKG